VLWRKKPPSEEQMLPVLQEQARTRGTRTKVVRARDAKLIADDLRIRSWQQRSDIDLARAQISSWTLYESTR
jgi:hypothetical protein